MKGWKNYFIIWGGLVVSSFLFGLCCSHQDMIFINAILLGLAIGLSVINALGNYDVYIDDFKEKYKNTALFLERIGKVDSLVSIFVLLVIVIAFMESMGWSDVKVNNEYLVGIAVLMCSLWCLCLVLGIWQFYINNKLKK